MISTPRLCQGPLPTTAFMWTALPLRRTPETQGYVSLGHAALMLFTGELADFQFAIWSAAMFFVISCLLLSL